MITPTAPTLDIVAKNHINILIQLAYADKHFVPAERDMIFRIGQKKNYSPDKVEFLLEHPEPIGTLGALSVNQKLDYLLDCIELVFVDEHVVDSELKFCRGIAMKMGLRVSVIDFLIENRADYNTLEFRERVIKEYFS
jgi:hypothetical protein